MTNNLDNGVCKTLPKSLRIFLWVDLLLLALSSACEVFCRAVLHLGFPYDGPLLFEHFPDLVDLRPRFQHFHTLAFYTDATDPMCMYPAPIAAGYRVFYLFRPHDLPVFLLFSAACFGVAAIILGYSLYRRELSGKSAVLFSAVVLLTAYPAWFQLKQANMEILPWVALCVGMWLYFRNKGYSAAACFGLAGALKITPFLYLGVFLARKQYRYIAAAFLSAAAVTVPSLWLAYPHILDSWTLTNSTIAKFRNTVSLRVYPQVFFDHSIFGIIKRVIYFHVSATTLSHVLTAYSLAIVLLFAVIYFIRIKALPITNQILCLCVATLILPPTSFDYTLLSLYVPWALLVFLAIKEGGKLERVPGLVAAMICFAILFVPETEFIFHAQSVGGQIKALVLIVLFGIALRYPFSFADEITNDGRAMDRSPERIFPISA